MKEIIMYILWDDIDGYTYHHLYLDRESAEIGLKEHYTEFFIHNNRARIEEIKAVSYLKEK